MLSILLPSYNNKCYALVAELQRQCEEYFCGEKSSNEADDYEIIVADDGSRDQVSIIANMLINELPHCKYIRRRENVGRSAIRNFLISQAKGEWMMLLDSDVDATHSDFIAHYMDVALHDNRRPLVIYGGVEVTGTPLPHNLRYVYEKEAEPRHSATERSKAPYRDFHTANILATDSVFAKCLFDENIRTYGYEDVIFGKTLQQQQIPVVHINNPVALNKHDSNEQYLRKVEESIRTLHTFSNQLGDTSPLLQMKTTLQRYHLLWTVKAWHRCFAKAERRNLLGNTPNLTVLKLYKLGLICCCE